MDSVPVRPGDVIAGKFRVDRLLGEGGMGVVVAAQHLELDQRVAVKFLLPEIARRADAAERFRREARAAFKLRCEHVARVLDVGTADGVPYMVMEYLEGHDLGREIRTRTELMPVVEAVTYILEACEAIAEAHANGIIHRDLKPANLFLASRPDGTRLVKILDFGISKSVTTGSMEDLSLTNTSALIGSPLYMSPEQMQSAKNVDARSDIWALGAILYQLLTGRPPYQAESIPQLCSALLNDTPTPVHEYRHDVAPDLEAALSKALEKDKLRRFSNVGLLALALAPHAPRAKIHAERAARVLSVIDPEVPPPDATRAPSLVSSDQPTLNRGVAVSATPNELGTQRTFPSSPKPVSDKTLASWGKTGDPVQLIEQRPRSKRIYFIAAAGLGVAAALVGWGIAKTKANAAPAASAIAPVDDRPKPPPEPTPPPASETTSTASASEPAPIPSASAAPPSPKSVVAPTRPAQKPTAPSAKPASTVPDFGGRH